ncbi:hypothetical protein HPP92_010547 [Vanilla planifolia]|uniref:Uncharacterized protein n=1 Tax=Vanilla planifolia TaxID=51239 RepID=A0A835R4S3_VANPL|nr:hypothetical protein HPP92_010786 [Vanilla planifolia]KAG0482463.1 hypothetical protein HPP92_010547 [Vanilla planifolia]
MRGGFNRILGGRTTSVLLKESKVVGRRRKKLLQYRKSKKSKAVFAVVKLQLGSEVAATREVEEERELQPSVRV